MSNRVIFISKAKPHKAEYLDHKSSANSKSTWRLTADFIWEFDGFTLGGIPTYRKNIFGDFLYHSNILDKSREGGNHRKKWLSIAKN